MFWFIKRINWILITKFPFFVSKSEKENGENITDLKSLDFIRYILLWVIKYFLEFYLLKIILFAKLEFTTIWHQFFSGNFSWGYPMRTYTSTTGEQCLGEKKVGNGGTKFQNNPVWPPLLYMESKCLNFRFLKCLW